MEYRKYLKNPILEDDTDQMKGLPIPSIQKLYPKDAKLIDLVSPESINVADILLVDAINNRQSRRKYLEAHLTMEELSFLLWATQGVKELARGGRVTKRTVPSGGAMHPYETYLVVNNIEQLEPGLYRYLAIEHKLLVLDTNESDLSEKIVEVCHEQAFIGKAAVVFIWTARPYRMEWRYGEDSLKDILMGVGHICQNLYLACEAIGAGTCAIVAYNQDELDKFINVDGENEIALYLAPVGKV
ncbi:MAG: SagB/ThcOx family dehydrogenase [Candidatus Lokiarchaeota archaeon]|nr:SagB/ThcOx family dehydrogenase [Candidatus Lokiarchaeota archaeon]